MAGGRGSRGDLGDRPRHRQRSACTPPDCATPTAWRGSRPCKGVAAPVLWTVANERDETRQRPGARLPDIGARRRLLRLALQLVRASMWTSACSRRTPSGWPSAVVRRTTRWARTWHALGLASSTTSAQPDLLAGRCAGRQVAGMAASAPPSARRLGTRHVHWRARLVEPQAALAGTRWSSCRSSNGQPAGLAGGRADRLRRPGRRGAVAARSAWRVDRSRALLVADDVGNTVWRVTPR